MSAGSEGSMTIDEVIRLAQEAGFTVALGKYPETLIVEGSGNLSVMAFAKFAELVAVRWTVIDEITHLRGAQAAADERLANAARRVGIVAGCDAADWMADEIEHLRSDLTLPADDATLREMIEAEVGRRLSEAGQYVTNDASRNAALDEEREACATIAEAYDTWECNPANNIAEMIRARKAKR